MTKETRNPPLAIAMPFDEALTRFAGTDKKEIDAADRAGAPAKTIAGTPDSPLRIGSAVIDCYVLEDETRVVSQRGMLRSLGFARGGPRNEGESSSTGAELPRFATQKWIEPHLNSDLEVALKSPIPFRAPAGGTAYGYPATILADICDAVLEADKAGDTTERQAPIVDSAMTLMRGFARVGIIALVDEATGYQEIRARSALADILESFLTDYRQRWVKTFPEDFYQQIYRLRNWEWKPWSTKRPSVIGTWTDDFVYDRLAPGLTDELRAKNPTNGKGERLARHHQWFNPEFGHPKLKEHISGVIALMRAATSWDEFQRSLDRAYPKFGKTIPMASEW